MNHTELLIRRQNVAAFIKADSVTVQFTRPGTSIKTEAGGYVPSAPTTLPPQQGRIVQNKRRFNNGLVNAEAGDIPHTDYLLIMTHDKDVEKDDHFTWLGEHYQVTGIHEQRQESILCSIDYYGKPNRA